MTEGYCSEPGFLECVEFLEEGHFKTEKTCKSLFTDNDQKINSGRHNILPLHKTHKKCSSKLICRRMWLIEI
jgi:hypothetical protein